MPLIPLFWTSGDVCSGFQCQDGSLACFLACVILRFTSGVTPADCIEVSMAAEPFWYLCTCRYVHKHWSMWRAQRCIRCMRCICSSYFKQSISWDYWQKETAEFAGLQTYIVFLSLSCFSYASKILNVAKIGLNITISDSLSVAYRPTARSRSRSGHDGALDFDKEDLELKTCCW